MQSDYQKHINEKRMELIRQVTKELPKACGDFLRAISTTTSTLTRLAYAYDLRIFFTFLTTELPHFGHTDMRNFSDKDIDIITRRDLEQFVEYLTMYYKNMEDENNENLISKPVYNHELGIMRKLSTLRSFFEYLFSGSRITSNVTTLVPLPKLHEKPILRLEQKEVEKMLSIVQSGDKLSARQQKYQALTRLRDYAMLCLFLGTGIRVSECVGINLDDIDFSQNAFLVTRKGGSQVMLYFPQEVADALLSYIEERKHVTPLPGHEEALFLSLQKRRITQRAVQNLVKKYALLASPLKKRISPHKLRSTFGTNLYHETGDIYLVADVLGHADVNTTRKHYAAMTEARRREAANYVRLPENKKEEDFPGKDEKQES
jgi:site-specific recombinase XerD